VSKLRPIAKLRAFYGTILSLSYSSKINGLLYPQRVFQSLKKHCDIYSNSNGRLVHFFEFELAGHASNFKKMQQKGQEDPKSSTDTLRPDFQANTRPRIFLKPRLPQDTGKRLYGKPGKDNFELMMSEHCVGRRAL
jgi:hypothetical protein